MQLMTRKNFIRWLVFQKPDFEEVAEFTEYVHRWTACLKNGGGDYAQDLQKFANEFYQGKDLEDYLDQKDLDEEK